MEVANNKEESCPESLTGMSRPAKLFIKIDKDGYLIDSLAISDVVNFDCIESIVTSAKRIISLFTDITPVQVDITGLFYYKKRARSLRMNPVPLITTTDGFRAVAEHPSGEIPLGIEWEEKSSKSASSAQINTINAGEKRSRSGSPAAEVPEKKKLKLDVPSKYKTYMPTTTENTPTVPMATTVSSGDTHEPPELIIRREEVVKVSKAMNSPIVYKKIEDQAQVQYIHSIQPEDVKRMQIPKLVNGEDPSKRNHRQAKVNYHWTEDVSCEVVMSYNGITERRKVKPQLSPIIQSLMKGDYGVLRSDIHQSLAYVANESKQETLDAFNFKDGNKQKQITYLNDAKTEVFKVLSALCMSKARFKDLLDWMKTLKLEEGNQGKYYLSERNVIGGGLRVMYDTDEQVASKLNSLQKVRGKTKEKTKVLYPITPLQTALTSSNMSKQGNYMIMVPSSNTAGGVTPVPQSGIMGVNSKPGDPHLGVAPIVQAGQSLLPLVTTVNSTNQPHPAWSKEALSKSIESKTSLVSLLNRAPKSITSTTKTGTSTSESPKQTSRHPNILRSKSHKLVPPSGEPTPMHLFRSYKADIEQEIATVENFQSSYDDNAESTLSVVIKQEPLEYNSTEDENSKHSQDETSNKFKGVLNTDAQMPVDNENSDSNMELVIKTEPIDDFVS